MRGRFCSVPSKIQNRKSKISSTEPGSLPPQLPHLGPQPRLHHVPRQGNGEAGHWIARDPGQVGEPLECLEREVADVAEFVFGKVEEVFEGDLAAEEVEVHE